MSLLKTASIIIVSEQIVESTSENRIADFFRSELRNLNLKLRTVLICSENENEVSYYIDFFIKYNDFLIIIAPLQNGIVSSALAKATYQKLEPYDKMTRRKQNAPMHACLIPTHAKLIFHDDDAHPLIHMQQIYLLDELNYENTFRSILENVLRRQSVDVAHQKVIDFRIVGDGCSCESVRKLNGVLDVEVEDDAVKVTLNGGDIGELVAAEREFKAQFTNLEEVGARVTSIDWQEVYSDRNEHVRKAFDDIERCLEQYGIENVFLSFNGGKDCTVLLHLTLTVIKVKYSSYSRPLTCLYVQSESPFVEQNQFISDCEAFYNLNIVTVQGSIKDALQKCLTENPEYKACLLGTRRTDPYCSNMEVFQMTDGNWPQIMRVSPVLDWHHSDIWDYLLYFRVPYCSLYDQGYTSLGNSENTSKNPSLLYYNIETQSDMYLPAYKLMKESYERNGRN